MNARFGESGTVSTCPSGHIYREEYCPLCGPEDCHGAMLPHSGDSRCVCTDGLAMHRDVTELCNEPVTCCGAAPVAS